jgi:hypothetical protein
VVDGSGLENRRTRKGTGGSNPSLSAMTCVILYLHHGDTYTDSAGYTFSGFPAPRSSEVWPKNGAISLDMTASTKFLI